MASKGIYTLKQKGVIAFLNLIRAEFFLLSFFLLATNKRSQERSSVVLLREAYLSFGQVHPSCVYHFSYRLLQATYVLHHSAFRGAALGVEPRLSSFSQLSTLRHEWPPRTIQAQKWRNKALVCHGQLKRHERKCR